MNRDDLDTAWAHAQETQRQYEEDMRKQYPSWFEFERAHAKTTRTKQVTERKIHESGESK